MIRLNKKGFTLVEIMIVGAIVGLLAVMAIPNLTKVREVTYRSSCFNNMRQIESAKQQWILETLRDSSSTANESDLAPYIRGGFPQCPANGTYTISDGDTAPSCSIHGLYPR